MDYADQASAYETMHRNAMINARQETQHFGPSLTTCEECGTSIPEARQAAVKGVRLCVDCQESKERPHG